MIEINPYNVKIHNVVAVVTLYQMIDLIAIVKNFRNVVYRPKRFAGLVFRLKKPNTATLIFTTGKMVCTGAKSEKMARSAVRKVVRKLKKAGIITFSNIEIVVTNIVASADLGGKVDVEAAQDILLMMYEPDQFPAAVYRMDEPKVVILIFVSGKIVITGAKNEEQVRIAVVKIREILIENELLY